MLEAATSEMLTFNYSHFIHRNKTELPPGKKSPELLQLSPNTYYMRREANQLDATEWFNAHAEDPVYVPPLQPIMLQLATMPATAASCTRYLYRHYGCKAAHGDATAHPYKCRSVEMHHIAYQIGLWFPFLCVLRLQPPYTDMVYITFSSCTLVALCN